MLLLPLFILSIILYIIGNRVSSVLIFFFFLFDGFQIVPDMFFDTHIGISKSFDFAFLYMLVLFIYGLIRYKDFIPINRVSKIIAVYLSFIIICIAISTFYYHISLVDIGRTSRTYFLVLSYFVIKRLEKEEFYKLLNTLFIITLFQCGLFIIQGFTGIALLTGAESGRDGIITRFYNVPLMLYFFVFYAIFCNPYKGWLKVITTVIPSVTMFLPLARSLMMAFIACLFMGIYIKFSKIKKTKKYLNYLLIIIIPIFLFTAKNSDERTFTDINNVLKGDFLEVGEDFELDQESTFMFRMAHFFERFLGVTESNMGIIFGAGFMAENSEYTSTNFDFQIGLTSDDTGNTVQLDTSDTSWSNFIIRYGVIGTIIYLFCYILLICYYWKHKDNKLSLFIFLYLILLFFISFTCDQLYQLRFLILPLVLFDFVNYLDDKENNNLCVDKSIN
jgi:hypothetical protein